MKPIIRAQNVSKQYYIGAAETGQKSLREIVSEAVKDPLRLLRKIGQSQTETIWALRDISFEVQPGETLGFIGPNGAGKSTLLKILSRITQPTDGRIEIYGHVGSLLEVGTGFHPELTGRENVFLNGAILGMKRDEIARKFDEIVAFSEVEKFIDTPVKYYSTGMYMRLAFSIAAHFEPEVLIVDEVLAVGDAQFQKKCLGKMSEVAQEGRTVLFVSHNMVAIQSLCNRVMWLHQGKILEQGHTHEVVSKYLGASISTRAEQRWEDLNTAPGNDYVRVRKACVQSLNGEPLPGITVQTPVIIEFEFWNLVPNALLNLSVVVSTEEGYPIFNTGSGRDNWHGKPFPLGLFRSTFHIPPDLLNDGTHRVHLYVVRDQTVVIYHLEDILIFEVGDVTDGRGAWYGKWIGAVRPNLKWETEFLGGSEPTLSAP